VSRLRRGSTDSSVLASRGSGSVEQTSRQVGEWEPVMHRADRHYQGRDSRCLGADRRGEGHLRTQLLHPRSGSSMATRRYRCLRQQSRGDARRFRSRQPVSHRDQGSLLDNYTSGSSYLRITVTGLPSDLGPLRLSTQRGMPEVRMIARTGRQNKDGTRTG